jgi:hypothetical protein
VQGINYGVSRYVNFYILKLRLCLLFPELKHSSQHFAVHGEQSSFTTMYREHVMFCARCDVSAMLLTMQVAWHVTLCCWVNSPRVFEEGMTNRRNYLPNGTEHSRTLQSCGYVKSVNVSKFWCRYRVMQIYKPVYQRCDLYTWTWYILFRILFVNSESNKGIYDTL